MGVYSTGQTATGCSYIFYYTMVLVTAKLESNGRNSTFTYNFNIFFPCQLVRPVQVAHVLEVRSVHLLDMTTAVHAL